MDTYTSTPMIAAQGLSKFYGPFAAVSDLTFTIPHGQIVALVGPNGAGKSTTMKILTGYLAASAGTVAVAGFDVRRDRLRAAARVGYLPENGPLYPDMTPLDLLRFCGAARGLPRARLKERIDAMAAQCDLQSILEKPIGKLSKGLRQRVGLAQALLHDPDVLIMDEPTAGLDPNQIRHFRSHLGELRHTKTLLISTHILPEVDATADRVLLIHNGRLVFDGTPGELKDTCSLEESFYRFTHAGVNESASGEAAPAGAPLGT